MVVEYWQSERWSHILNTIKLLSFHWKDQQHNVYSDNLACKCVRVFMLLLSLITFVVGAVLHVTWQPKVSKHHTIDWRDQHITSCNVPVFQNIWVRPQSETVTTPLSNKDLILFLKSEEMHDILTNLFPFPVMMQNVDDSWNHSLGFTPESTTEILL